MRRGCYKDSEVKLVITDTDLIYQKESLVYVGERRSLQQPQSGGLFRGHRELGHALETNQNGENILQS